MTLKHTWRISRSVYEVFACHSTGYGVLSPVLIYFLKFVPPLISTTPTLSSKLSTMNSQYAELQSRHSNKTFAKTTDISFPFPSNFNDKFTISTVPMLRQMLYHRFDWLRQVKTISIFCRRRQEGTCCLWRERQLTAAARTHTHTQAWPYNASCWSVGVCFMVYMCTRVRCALCVSERVCSVCVCVCVTGCTSLSKCACCILRCERMCVRVQLVCVCVSTHSAHTWYVLFVFL